MDESSRSARTTTFTETRREPSHLQSLAPREFKSCCASLYSDDALLFLLGPSLHPGGLDLTRRLADRLEISDTDTVLDVACGLGCTVGFLESNYGCNVLGIDLSPKLIRKASITSKSALVEYANADAEGLPFKSEAFTAVVSECSMCLMPEFGHGIGESFRVLQHGGKFGITDIAVEGSLPEELETVLYSLLCISRKTSPHGYSDLVEQLGFERVEVSEESASLHRMLEGVRKRLLLAELLVGTGKLAVKNDQVTKAKRFVALAKTAVEDHCLRYLMLTAHKP